MPYLPYQERMPAMWRDLLRVFFNLPVHYLYGGSTASYAAHATAGDDALLLSSHPSLSPSSVLLCLRISRSSLIPLLGVFHYSSPISRHHCLLLYTPTADFVPVDPSEAWPEHTKVITIYGAGTVLSFREVDR